MVMYSVVDPVWHAAFKIVVGLVAVGKVSWKRARNQVNPQFFFSAW
jgi:hypothetical protein